MIAPLLARGAEGDATSAQHAFIDENCGKCHNATDWAGGLAFDTLAIDKPGEDADAWEKAVRKLRGGLMPPPGEKQPTRQSIDGFVSWMEGRLDAEAGSHVDPGTVVLHRLNRTEYSRAVEDLLRFSVDARTILPKDVSSDGFDNVAATLQISPSFLEQYIAAARSIARRAVGRTEVMAGQPHLSPARQRSAQLRRGPAAGHARRHGRRARLPGGRRVRVLHPRFPLRGAGYVNRVDAPHRVVMLIDGERVFEQTVGGPEDLKQVDQRFAAAEGDLQARFNNIHAEREGAACTRWASRSCSVRSPNPIRRCSPSRCCRRWSACPRSRASRSPVRSR